MSLFWKIFAWFWAAMVVMGAALFLVVTATRPDPLPQAWRQPTQASLAVYAAQSAEAFESGGEPALLSSLQQLRRRWNARLWLYNAGARPIGRGPGQEPPSKAREAFKAAPDDAAPPQVPEFEPQSQPQAPRREGQFGSPGALGDRRDGFGRPDGLGPGRGPMPFHIEKRLSALVNRALTDDSDSAHFETLGSMVLMALRVSSPSGRRYVLAGETPRPPGGRAPIASKTLILGVGAVGLTGTLLCYGLVRYLLSQLIALRLATRRLAEGDLSARTGGGGRHSDEMADLGRDFDLMAGRIEALLLSQRRQVEAQRRLLGDISHELRSPLTRLGVALALARHHETSPKAREAHERIAIESVRLNDLIGQLLQLARLESQAEDGREDGREHANGAHSEIDLQHLVRDIAGDAEFEAHEKSRAVHVTQSQPCFVRGSEPLLRSAIENVVRNAIRHTHENTTVEVSLELQVLGQEPEQVEQDGTVRSEGKTPPSTLAVITVRDWGEGVPDSSLSELFKPFYRVESARDRDSGGVGLGLAITERAIRAHGGQVRASNALGGGLCVELRLPAAPDRESATVHRTGAPQVLAGGL